MQRLVQSNLAVLLMFIFTAALIACGGESKKTKTTTQTTKPATQPTASEEAQTEAKLQTRIEHIKAQIDELERVKQELPENERNNFNTKIQDLRNRQEILHSMLVQSRQEKNERQLEQTIPKLEETTDQLESSVESTWESVKDKSKTAAQHVKEGAKRVGRGVKEGAKEAAKDIQSGAQKTKEKIGAAAGKAGETLESGGKKVEEDAQRKQFVEQMRERRNNLSKRVKQQSDAIESKRKEVDQRLSALEHSSPEQWNQRKTEVEKSLTEYEQLINRQ